MHTDYFFVQVTKTYLASQSQAKRALAVARAINANVTFYTQDEDGTELSVTGDDYLTEQGTYDIAGAICDIPDPNGLLGIELVGSTTRELSILEVEELIRSWPDDWMDMPHRNGGSE